MNKYKQALLRIRDILGQPCSDNKCAGCREEVSQSIEVLTKTLGPYKKMTLAARSHELDNRQAQDILKKSRRSCS